ncbi:MAG: hypothetical protein I8H98_05250 [Moraxellaceae bacterium]|nr:hypothetical protein [Moraxellaceae bacterium]
MRKTLRHDLAHIPEWRNVKKQSLFKCKMNNDVVNDEREIGIIRVNRDK